MTKTVLLQEELTKLQELQNEKDSLVNYYGILEMEYQIQKTQLNNELISLNQKQEILGKELQEKYGDGSIDITTGDFIKS
jgi:hypothetical protein